MATFADKTTFTVTLDNDDTVTFIGNLNVTTVTADGRNLGTQYLTGTQKLGAYGQYATLTCVSITAGSYTVTSDLNVSPKALLALDANSNPIGLVNPKDGLIIPNSIQRIRASLSKALASNPQKIPPLAPAPTWAVNTVYYAGNIVRGLAVGSTDKLYYMCGSNATANGSGTSNISGTGPSGEGTGIITDATCVWIYFGKTSATTATPLVSTATLTTSADNMNGYLQFITNANFAAIGLVNYVPSNSGGTFATEAYFTGGMFGYRAAEGVSQPNGGSVGSPTYNNPPKNTMAFSTNARKWVGIKSSAAANLSAYYSVEVNGVILGESSISPPSTSNGCLIINLSLFKEGVKDIRIHWNNNTQQRLAYEVLVSADDSIWPTDNGNRVRLAVEGDSICNGSYISGAATTNLLFERLLADNIGADTFYNNAVGSTGVINNVSGVATTYLERVADIIAFAPDILVIGGFHNDVGNSGSYTSALRQGAILKYLQTIRAALPSCYIFVIGSQLLQNDVMTTGGAFSCYDVEVDAKAAVTTFNDSKTSFIPLMTDVRNRLTNANGRFYLQTGSAPYNDAHPIPNYYPFITSYLANKLAKFFSSITY